MSVNARRILNAIRDADHALNDPGPGGRIDPFGDLQICELVTTDAESRTLADPTQAGIRFTLRLKTDGGDCTVTADNGFDIDGNTQAVFADAGDQLELISVSHTTGYRWEVLVNTGPAALMGGQSITYLLSTEKTISAAWGLQKLVESYSGNCCICQRSSDSTSQTFGFGSDGNVDSAIWTFIGSSIGYLTTIYDQSGNGNDLVNATLSGCAVALSNGVIPGGFMQLGGARGDNTGNIATANYTIPSGVSLNKRDSTIALIGRNQGAHGGAYLYAGASSPQTNVYIASTLLVFDSVDGQRAGSAIPASNIDCLAFDFRSGSVKFNVEVSGSASALGVGTLTGGKFGQSYAGGFPSPYYAAVGVVAFSQSLGDTEFAAIRERIRSRYSLATSYTGKPNIVFVGDSLTAGFGSLCNTYPMQVISAMSSPNDVRWFNVGQSGLASAQLPTISTLYKSDASKNICAVMIGTNDFRGAVTAATCLANLTNFVTAAKAAGFTVIACTVPPGGGVNETQRASFNASVLSGSSGADHVADVGNAAQLATPSNATYFLTDTLHFNSTGSGVVAALVKAKIDLI